MAHGDAFRNPIRHARAGVEPPARWNELCIPRSSWRGYHSTVALASGSAAVTCRACLDALSEPAGK